MDPSELEGPENQKSGFRFNYNVFGWRDQAPVNIQKLQYCSGEGAEGILSWAQPFCLVDSDAGSPDPGICDQLIPIHKGNHTERSFGFSMAGCDCFVRLLHSSQIAGCGIWFPMGALNQLSHGELCPMTPVKCWPKRTKSQRHTLHQSQLSPALTARDRRPGQTVPCYGPRKGLCSWGCVCTGLIMIWKNVWFSCYNLWITDTQFLDGA